MSEPIVYLNGRFLPASQAKLNIYDLGIYPVKIAMLQKELPLIYFIRYGFGEVQNNEAGVLTALAPATLTAAIL